MTRRAILIPASSQKLLRELGLVPPNCHNVELIIPAAAPMMFRYDVYVVPEDAEKLALVFQGLVSELKADQDGPPPPAGTP